MRLNKDEFMHKPSFEPGVEDDDRINPLAMSAFAAAASFAIPAIINSVLDAFSSAGNQAQSIDSNTIDLTCVVSDDLPANVRNQYCESLEVIYAYMVRSILSTNTYSKKQANTRGILASIPLLTSSDKISMIGNTLYNTAKRGADYVGSGKSALAVFNESFDNALNEKYRILSAEFDAGMEADPIVKESRASTGKWINVSLDVTSRAGKNYTKNVSIGIRVRPKVISRSDFLSFFVKRNTQPIEPDKVASFSLKRALSSLFRKKKEIPVEVVKGQVVLDDLMRKVSGIKKPFVCILVSQNVADELQDEYSIDLGSMTYAKKLYNMFPILSIGIYNTNADTITASLNPGAGFVTRSASAFNSEIASYEKQLAEYMTKRSYL